MKLKDLLESAQAAIVTEKQQSAIAKIKERLVEIEEMEKALATAKSNLKILLDSDLEDFDVNVW